MATPTTTPGQVTPGNIDLNNRPIVANSDGSYSTVRSITITVDGKAVLIPTVVGGKVVSNDEAIAHYRKTGENLGTFTDESRANAYAQQLHEQQAAQYSTRGAGMAKPAQPITGADLGKTVRLDPSLDKIAGDAPPLDNGAAVDILAQRLVEGLTSADYGKLTLDHTGGIGQERASKVERDLAVVIAQALPEKLRTASVLASIDLRPYLTALDGKTITGDRVDPGWTNAFGALGATQATTYKASTKDLVTAETARIVKNGGKGDFNSNVASAVSVPASTPGAPGAGTTPGTTATAGGVTIDPATGQVVFAGIDQAAGAPSFPVTSMRRMVSDDLWTLARAADEEANQNAKLGSGFFPVDVGMTGRTMTDTGSTRGQGQVLPIASAIDFIHTLKPSEVESIQHKLAAGGYFDKLPNGGGTFTPGDSFDHNTMDAWKLLLTDSIAQNRDAPAVLGEAVKNYHDNIVKQRLGQISKFDPTYSTMLANTYSQSVTGHDLTPNEANALSQHLQMLIKQRAGATAGMSNPAGSLPNADGYNQTDVEVALEHTPGFHADSQHENEMGLEYKLAKLMH